MTYTNTEPIDILYKIGNPMDDFSIFYLATEGEQMPVEKSEIVNEILPVLTYLNEESGYSFTSLFNRSSEELNSLAISKSITLTLTQIVAFNEMKLFISELQSNISSQAYSIGKIDYIELRLDRTLTQEEIDALELLQLYYPRSSLVEYTTTITGNSLYSGSSYSGVESAFVVIVPDPPTEEELAIMEVAYDLLAALSGN